MIFVTTPDTPDDIEENDVDAALLGNNENPEEDEEENAPSSGKGGGTGQEENDESGDGEEDALPEEDVEDMEYDSFDDKDEM